MNSIEAVYFVRCLEIYLIRFINMNHGGTQQGPIYPRVHKISLTGSIQVSIKLKEGPLSLGLKHLEGIESVLCRKGSTCLRSIFFLIPMKHLVNIFILFTDYSIIIRITILKVTFLAIRCILNIKVKCLHIKLKLASIILDTNTVQNINAYKKVGSKLCHAHEKLFLVQFISAL